jgi:hypothetical protein
MDIVIQDTSVVTGPIGKNRVVGIVAGVMDWMVCGSNSSKGRRLFSSSKHPD